MTLLASLLAAVTILVELLGLGLSVWIGLALVALEPRAARSWAAAALCWALGLLFALSLLGSSGTPLAAPAYVLLRWLLIPLPLAWLWLLHALFPARLWPLLARLRWLAVALTLGLLALTLAVGPLAGALGLPSGRWVGLFYPAYLLAALGTLGPTMGLAARAARLSRAPARRDARRALAVATALVLLAALLRLGGFWLGARLPMLPGALALLAALVALGGALLLSRIAEGRANALAFAYHLATAAAVTLLYSLLVGGAALLWGLSWWPLVLVVPLAVATHWLTDWTRSRFDALFYRAPVQRLRADLRALALTVDGSAKPPLDSLLAHLAVRAGAVALALVRAEEGALRALATSPPALSLPPLDPALLRAPRPTALRLPPRLPMATGAAWLMPLRGEGAPAALVAWSGPARGFSDLALALLEEASDALATLLVAGAQQQRRLEEIEALVGAFRTEAESLRREVAALEAGTAAGEPSLGELPAEARAWVEEGLRHLHDVAYLGQHQLAALAVVATRLPPGGAQTHLERGQAVRALCEALIERLRPPGPLPPEPLPAEYRLWSVLHDAYVERAPNREIMARLYIGEGTFHRARRQALDGIAEALVELERAARDSAGPGEKEASG